jgi:hypothetical protein
MIDYLKILNLRMNVCNRITELLVKLVIHKTLLLRSISNNCSYWFPVLHAHILLEENHLDKKLLFTVIPKQVCSNQFEIRLTVRKEQQPRKA